MRNESKGDKNMKKFLFLFFIGMICFFMKTNVHAEDFIAQIGTNTYTNLQDALDNVQEGQTIKLLRDIQGNESYQRSADKTAITFTLDLNTHSITSTTSNAILSINDSSTITIKGNGKIENTGNSAALLIFKGKVILESVLQS